MASALLAWFLTPPVGRIAAFGTFLGGGYAGTRVGKSLREQRRSVVPAAIADLVRDGGLASLKPEDVAKLQERYDVDAAEFEAQLSEIYAKYLRQLINADDNTPAQIKQLGQLRRGIGLRCYRCGGHGGGGGWQHARWRRWLERRAARKARYS